MLRRYQFFSWPYLYFDDICFFIIDYSPHFRYQKIFLLCHKKGHLGNENVQSGIILAAAAHSFLSLRKEQPRLSQLALTLLQAKVQIGCSEKKNTIMSSDRNGPIFFFTVSQNLFLIQIWPYTEEEIENILPCNQIGLYENLV